MLIITCFCASSQLFWKKNDEINKEAIGVYQRFVELLPKVALASKPILTKQATEIRLPIQPAAVQATKLVTKANS